MLSSECWEGWIWRLEIISSFFKKRYLVIELCTSLSAVFVSLSTILFIFLIAFEEAPAKHMQIIALMACPEKKWLTRLASKKRKMTSSTMVQPPVSIRAECCVSVSLCVYVEEGR